MAKEQVNLDYSAGIFDGEGSFSFQIAIRKPHKKNGKIYIAFYMMARVTLSHESGRLLLILMCDCFKAHDVQAKILPRNRVDANTFIIQDQQNLSAFCELIADKIILKRQQAYAMIDIIKEITAHTTPRDYDYILHLARKLDKVKQFNNQKSRMKYPSLEAKVKAIWQKSKSC